MMIVLNIDNSIEDIATIRNMRQLLLCTWMYQREGIL